MGFDKLSPNGVNNSTCRINNETLGKSVRPELVEGRVDETMCSFVVLHSWFDTLTTNGGCNYLISGSAASA
jgi:hypothetical protein